ncbi:DUF1415 domain-containing protein [Piscirickettsia litoralis]|uniref:DUF1415 domain-containing protein n=1 Tax=Piscirickettsia litoralis TaxID=1891921 RepID=A0ABX3A249_9GAMM|nr:DUF1415 domain-containing protein [Piscirickettsia litoralis]ODN42931.1 hypothetical protein BGC07_08345 [Piscirickettsia litoralis]
MTHYNSDHLITATQNWLEQVIIGHNFCPFAVREFKRNSIRYLVNTDKKIAAMLETLVLECKYLDTHPQTETTLVIFSTGVSQFERFLDLLDLANALLIKQGYEGIYQLASFHPDYCFADADLDDPANYTNRSPYPTLHLIREASLERVLEKVAAPAAIPERNISHARELGLNAMQLMLKNCYSHDDDNNE